MPIPSTINWLYHIKSQEKSYQTVVHYCRVHKLSPQSFYQNRRQHRAALQSKSLVPVVVQEKQSDEMVISKGKVSIRVPLHIPTCILTEVINGLYAASED